MKRITIYSSEMNEQGGYNKLGWFDLDAAEHVLEESSRWDGQVMRGVISQMQINRAQLYRTKGGRWVENQDSRPEFNGPNRWRFLTDDEARNWMVKSGGTEAEEALEKWFPDTPDEVGPSLGGRPTVGPKVEVRLDHETLAQVDALAAKKDVTRAEMLRRLIVSGLQETNGS
ncbi:CopG family transcriptional regulator [Streptomyces achromogenes]|uniref:ribbon-helix-helix domain-containing protein n=1 Tax=Streptomyces achromogenes TaxID=67255 RepID=UPI003A7FDA5A